MDSEPEGVSLSNLCGGAIEEVFQKEFATVLANIADVNTNPEANRCWVPKLITPFKFGMWMDPESFVIGCQSGFQRTKIENEDGTFAADLDYVLKVASNITAEAIDTSEDDGIAQKVAMRRGVVLKEQTNLKPRVNLAPYRTFAEIDQQLSQFLFRARVGGESVNLALFEADGGRWHLSAVAAIAEWLNEKIAGKVPVIS